MQLVRKKLIFQAQNTGIIKYNYYYDLMKEIYAAVTIVDNIKSLKLHEEGYQVDNKKYKLFNYNLIFESVKGNDENGLLIPEGSKVELVISGADEVINLIIKGFIKAEEFILNNVYLKLVDMKNDRGFKFNKIMLYRTRTPVVESIYDADNKRVLYLSPLQQHYYQALGQNLLRKYKLIYGKDYTGELYFDIENTLKIKKKFIQNIKNNYLIGYQDYEMYIEADSDMQKVAYYLGIGQNNSIGMGHVTYITGRRN